MKTQFQQENSQSVRRWVEHVGPADTDVVGCVDVPTRWFRSGPTNHMSRFGGDVLLSLLCL